jgi:hypothetical protein
MLEASLLAMSRGGRGRCCRVLFLRVLRRARWMLGGNMSRRGPWLVSFLRVVLWVLGDVVGGGVRFLRPLSEDSRDFVVV